MSPTQIEPAALKQPEVIPHFSPWCLSWAKRASDLLLSGFLLICLAPLMLLVAILAKTSSPGPAIFRQLRVGQNGCLFAMYKFRTMYWAGTSGSGLTADRDPRITPTGSFLRKWKLDELPQLFNVFAGQMSMVGPRPDLPEFISCLPDNLRPILSLRPGMTSLASVRYRNESMEFGRDVEPRITQSYIERIMPDKVRIDLQYAEDACLAKDLGVMLRTGLAILG